MRANSIAAFMILLIAVFICDSQGQTRMSSGSFSQTMTKSNQFNTTINTSPYPTGLGLTISFMPYYSTLSNETMRNYALTVGLSYTFSSSIAAEMRFYTGEEVLTDRQYLPVKGKLLLGAGDIRLKSYLADFSSTRLYAGVGAGLQTILTEEQKGYNGYGMLLFTGGEYLISRAFTISAGLNYRRCYYTTFVNGGNWSYLNSTFADNWFGVDIVLNIYFK